MCREAGLHNKIAGLLHATGRVHARITHLKQTVVLFAEIGVEGNGSQRF